MKNTTVATRRRHIDHLVLAVHDLEAAAALYARLGFLVGARNRHPWGTANHVIQFRSSYLELITVAEAERIPPHSPRAFSFGQFVKDYLSRREGLAMFVLDSVDAQADAADYAHQGIGDFQPFFFERTGRAADGSETHVAFTLAFALDERLPNAAFFVCQHHHPEAFWSAPLQRHSNGATNVAGACLQVEQPGDHTGFLRAFTGEEPSNDGLHYDLAHGGRLRLHAASAANGFIEISIYVPDLGVMARRLTAENLPFEELPDRIEIAANQCFGVRIQFVPDRTTRLGITAG